MSREGAKESQACQEPGLSPPIPLDHSNTFPSTAPTWDAAQPPQLSEHPGAGRNSPGSVQIRLSWAAVPHLLTTEKKTQGKCTWLGSLASAARHASLSIAHPAAPSPPHQLSTSRLCPVLLPSPHQSQPIPLVPFWNQNLPNSPDYTSFHPVFIRKPSKKGTK